MINIDFGNKPIVMDGVVGDKLSIPCEEDITVVADDTVFALLKFYFFNNSTDFRHATEEEAYRHRIKKLQELTGVQLEANLNSVQNVDAVSEEVEEPKNKNTTKKTTTAKKTTAKKTTKKKDE